MLFSKLKQSLRDPTGHNLDQLDDVMPDAQSTHAPLKDAEVDESDEEYHQIQAEIRRNIEESDQALLLA